VDRDSNSGDVYKTQAARLQQDYGYEPTPAPIKMIDASVDPPKIIKYLERPGADSEDELEDAENKNAIMMFEAVHNLSCVECTSRSHRTKNVQCQGNFGESNRKPHIAKYQSCSETLIIQ
jgi:hypothetical protein